MLIALFVIAAFFIFAFIADNQEDTDKLIKNFDVSLYDD
jgi:hypothetical protein